MLILGIESSCDETAAAVLRDGVELLSDVVNSQIEVHVPYGGVVPELASRQHLEDIYPVVHEALQRARITLDDLDGIAVTCGPGLIGSLLVGLSFAKALSFVKKIPYVAVDHMAGHLASIHFAEQKPSYPLIALIASGGHTSIFLVTSATEYSLLGRTRDDAAGEAFDKVGKLLSLEYPGGPVISRLAADGDPSAVAFPRAWLEPDSLDFSFSGLKTAVASFVRQQDGKNNAVTIPDLCASFQEAVVDVLVEKTLTAAKKHNCGALAMAGGVAANPRLRAKMQQQASRFGLTISVPAVHFCTDNAAMIAMAGSLRFAAEATMALDTDVYSRAYIMR